MASSSNTELHHAQQRPARLARHNSSFLGAIKNIVKAPLTWFANQDDHDAASGKRRRPVELEPTEEFIPKDTELGLHGRSEAAVVDSDDGGTRRSKRMRLHSPPRHSSQPYLDPPAASLRRVDPSRRASVIPRASSAVLPSSGASRATLSPRRHLPIARTMSIDPPQRPVVRHDSSAFDFGPPPPSAESDYDMAVDTFRDVSMPPSPSRSPRPSFRMRSSVTPQPQQPTRYISEPPPLNSLISNPVFLHPPVQPAEPSVAPTLGTLVDSVRATKSPTRQQHGSLLFISTVNPPQSENEDAPAERALQQLDVYKTPLLPTRMRSSNLPASITATTTPDMFKSRRKAHLVLTQEGRDRIGRKVSGSGKSPVINGTKPYAGEGGMKKLLARRKQEVEEEEEDNEQKEKEAKSIDEDGTPRARQPSPPAIRTIPPPSVPSGSDWFSTATSGSSSSSGSSLRVGRTKISRNHFQRPAKTRFSAVYEEEVDDNMEDEEKQKDRETLEEAAKKVPVFSMPAGFSFAKDVHPVKPADLDSAKEPPLTSLPFSLAKPAPSSIPSVTAESKEKTSGPPSSTLQQPPAPARVPMPEPKFTAPTHSLFSLAPPSAPAPSGIPNFFANSSVLRETALPSPPPVLNFDATTTTPIVAPPAATISAPFSFGAAPSASTPSKPVADAENPFWDGGKKAAEEPKPAQSLFAGFGKKDGSSMSISSDLGPAKPALPFSFGKAPQETAASTSTLGATTGITSAAPKLPFSFGAPVETKKPESETVAPKPLFGGSATTATLLGEASKPSSSGNLFGAPAPPQSTPSPLPFSFAAKAAPAVEAPKPLFGGPGGGGAFSFGQPPAAEKKEEAKAPFSFGAPPSTPPIASIAAPKPATAPAPMFSFSGGGSAAADVSSKQLFMFGQPTMAPIERPVTPPKNNDNEFRMEESPTRELQQMNGSKLAESRPTIGGGAFSFGIPSSTAGGGSLFGQNAALPLPASNAFNFGAATSTPFGPKVAKAEEPKGFSGFGQTAAPTAPSISTSFSFGQQAKSPEDAQRPSTAGGFSGFGATPTSATTSTGNAFAFGAPAASNPFAQQPAPGSAPSSPSTFNQPSPFTGPFAFGSSQPSSPATGGNQSLPPSGFGTGGGFGQPQQPSSPFSGPIALAPSTSSGGSLFTIGASPAPAPGAPRQIKKLPNRRGGAKR
ncbi:hypothetical protein BDZ97DRAFT_1818002 [Flammula alnicola]|nr:hypothetical protein BDZ97DRAFT_1818002 [Flammula alnicola]